MTNPDHPRPESPASVPPPSDRPPSRPWRTEGVPGGPTKPPPAWSRWLMWPVGYLILFALFTYQDRMSKPQAVAYTEFKAEVAAKNVAEVFARGDTIQGALKKPAALPGDRLY